MDRVGTAQREIDGIESAGRPVRQLLGELDRGLAGEVEIAGGVRQPPHLFGRGRDHAFLAVADVDAPQASKSVEQFAPFDIGEIRRSEEHTSELQSLMRISYAVFCLKKKKHKQKQTRQNTIN